MKPATYFLGVLGLLGTLAWFVSAPGWEPAVAILLAISTLTGLVMTNGANGQGGKAIVVGENGSIDLENDGSVVAGNGGTGGNGGDAIWVDPGVKIIIKNRGVIAGGDAGGSSTEKK